jgi:hypothetical protein
MNAGKWHDKFAKIGIISADNVLMRGKDSQSRCGSNCGGGSTWISSEYGVGATCMIAHVQCMHGRWYKRVTPSRNVFGAHVMVMM